MSGAGENAHSLALPSPGRARLDRALKEVLGGVLGGVRTPQALASLCLPSHVWLRSLWLCTGSVTGFGGSLPSSRLGCGGRTGRQHPFLCLLIC